MSIREHYESKLWAILAKEQLVDLSQFHRSGFFDELPLFSRESDIEFLSKHRSNDANRILIDFALKYLKAVVSYEAHRSPFVAAITVWSPPEQSRIVPNLFVWSGSVQKLRSKLVLGLPTTPFAKKVEQIVMQKHPSDGFEVLEDSATEPGDTRVFISFSQPPYGGFVPLRQFAKPRVALC